MSNNLQSVMLDALNEFKRKTKHFPKKIIIYRDGVGQS